MLLRGSLRPRRLPWFRWPSSLGRVLGISWKEKGKEQAAFPVPLRTGLSPSRGQGAGSCTPALGAAPGHCLGWRQSRREWGWGSTAHTEAQSRMREGPGAADLGSWWSGECPAGECPSQGPCPGRSPGSQPLVTLRGALACPLCWEGAGGSWRRRGVLREASGWLVIPAGCSSELPSLGGPWRRWSGCAVPQGGGGASAFCSQESGLPTPFLGCSWEGLGQGGVGR